MNEVAVGYGVMWESKYISEGRNNLDDGGLFSMEVDFERDSFAGGIWFAMGDSTSYEELNLFLEYGFDLGPLEAYIGYTRLEFTADNESDNEIGLGLAYGDLPYVTVGVDSTYSTEASGVFVELYVGTEIFVFDGRVVLEPYILQGIDFGYASDDHDGFNNFQAGIEGHAVINEHIALIGSIHHTWAQKDVRNDGLGDELWIGIGFSGQF
jgi:hypothetical protein